MQGATIGIKFVERFAAGGIAMIYYTKEHFLESPDFPFHIEPYEFRSNVIAPHKPEFIECVVVAEGEGDYFVNKENSLCQ
jgi:hypothetical protein